jgi:hypothetical protein
MIFEKFFDKILKSKSNSNLTEKKTEGRWNKN